MATVAYGADEEAKGGHELRLRRTSPTPMLVPSLSESSVSDLEEVASTSPKNEMDNGNGNATTSTLHKIVTSTAFQKRLSRQSSLPWGHKPSPLIGASCFLFALPIPLFLRACCPFSAFCLACVTVSSYMSDHVYTGLESWAHAADRFLAPMAFSSCVYSITYMYGPYWASLSLAALKCHLLANYYSKNGIYEKFVIWHSLWHVVGVGIILFCFAVNGVVGNCWEGRGWESIFHERFMI